MGEERGGQEERSGEGEEIGSCGRAGSRYVAVLVVQCTGPGDGGVICGSLYMSEWSVKGIWRIRVQ